MYMIPFESDDFSGENSESGFPAMHKH